MEEQKKLTPEQIIDKIVDEAKDNSSYDIILLSSVTNANPNGDIDTGNQPRVAIDGKGIITDVCIKSRVKDTIPVLLEDEEDLQSLRDSNRYNLYCTTGKLLNDVSKAVYDKCKEEYKGLDETKWNEKLYEMLCNTYYDVRMTGAAFVNYMQLTDVTVNNVVGAVNCNISKSCDAINIKDLSITRQCLTNAKEKSSKAGNQNMIGRKSVVEYGLYRTIITIEGNRVVKNYVTKDDIKLYMRALCHMFEVTKSAMRSDIEVTNMIVVRHDHMVRRVAGKVIRGIVQTNLKPGIAVPNSVDDYIIDINTEAYNTHKEYQSVAYQVI